MIPINILGASRAIVHFTLQKLLEHKDMKQLILEWDHSNHEAYEFTEV